MKIKPVFLVMAVLLSLFSAAIASAQSFQTNVTYMCNGERLLIESCNMRDLSDTSTCLVQHPDRPLHNGFVAYTNETRGTLKKLIPTCKQPSAEEIARGQAFQKKQQDTQDAARANAVAQMDAPAPSSGPGKPAMDSGDQQLIRCLESGRSESQCFSNRLLNPVMGMVNALLPGAAETKRSGLDAIGIYKDQSLAVTLSGNSLQVTGCSDLVPVSLEFTVLMKGNQPVLIVQNVPQPFNFTFRPDGKLVGPGPVDVRGNIVIGYSDYWVTPAATPSNPNPIGHRESEPIFQPKTARCPIGVLAPTGPITPDTGNFLGFFDQSKQKTIQPGFRVEGQYSGPGGFSIQFFTEWAVLSCGESSDTLDYSVENTGSQTLVKIQDAGQQIVLSFRPDGTLAGSGQIPVNGRRITGKNANGDLIFVPRPATCTVGILSPGAPSQTMTASAAATTAPLPGPAPAPVKPVAASPAAASPSASGNAVLSIASGFPAPQGAANSLAGHTLVLLKDSFEVVLAKGGFQVPQGAMPFMAMINACKGGAPNCQTAIAAMNAETVVGVKIDPSGKATFPGVKPGTYYVMGSGAAPAGSGTAASQLLMWNVKVDLKAGTNSVTLDQRNATLVK